MPMALFGPRERHQQRGLLRRALRRRRPHRRLVPVAADRDHLLRDLGLHERRHPGRRARPSWSAPGSPDVAAWPSPTAFFAVVVLVICLYGFQFMLAGQQGGGDRRDRAVPGRRRSPTRATSTPATPGSVGYATRRRFMARLHRRHAARHGQPALVRRLPRRLVALHPAPPRLAQALMLAAFARPGGDAGPVHSSAWRPRRSSPSRRPTRRPRPTTSAGWSRSRPAGSCCPSASSP